MEKRIQLCPAVLLTALLLLLAPRAANAQDCRDRLDLGRAELFSPSLSDLRDAAAIFHNLAQDPTCADQPEAILFHALTRMVMLGIRDDSGAVDSAWELTRRFGIQPAGDSFYPFELDAALPTNEYGDYTFPADAPTAEDLRAWTDEQTIPELTAIIDLLDLLPPDFVLHLHPDETGLAKDLELDSSDVLVFKAALQLAKGLLEAQFAYNVAFDPNEVIPQLHADNLQINALLAGYPELLTLDTTVDAPAILAQARQDVIAALDLYSAAIDHITAETDDQLDDLLYLDAEMTQNFAAIRNHLLTVRASLADDTVLSIAAEKAMLYDLHDTADALRGDLALTFGPFDQPEDGLMRLEQDNGLTSFWEITGNLRDHHFYAECEYAGSNLQYTRSNISHAPSLLFTPVTDSLYRVSTVDPGLFDDDAGDPQGWQGAYTMWRYDLPFTFPFYGQDYTAVHVGSNGQIDFDGTSTFFYSWPSDLTFRKLIVPFWAYPMDVDEIYIHQPAPNAVTFRWRTTHYSALCQFAATLFADGRIRFDYGRCDRSEQCVGISNAQPASAVIVGYDWGQGLLSGIVNPDRSRLDRLTFERWGMIETELTGLHALHRATDLRTVSIDPNPVFGSSPRYPDPLAPRDLLPAFDDWNSPLPGTVAQGLQDQGHTPDHAATLGGIIPDMTQQQWTSEFDLQPGGPITLHDVDPLQCSDTPTGRFVDAWSDNQLVFSDPAGDHDPDDDAAFETADLAALYLAGNESTLHGAISLNNTLVTASQSTYELTFYSQPDQSSAPGDWRIAIHTWPDDGKEINVYQWLPNSWGGWWQQISVDAALRFQNNRIDFTLSGINLPDLIAGRFVTLDAEAYDTNWRCAGEDYNATHLRFTAMGEQSLLASITGNVTCPTSSDDIIIVRAYAQDPHDPIASAILAGPGPFQLTDIPLGWSGYVAASAMAGGFNPLGNHAEWIESALPVTLDQTTLNLELTLQPSHDQCLFAQELHLDQLVSGTNVGATGDDADLWYRFTPPADAVYSLEFLAADFDAMLTILDGCGGEEILEHYCWNGPAFLNAPAHDPLILRVSGIHGHQGTFTLIATNFAPAIPNDLCESAPPILLDTPVSGSTLGATGEALLDRGDEQDVWYSFTAPADALHLFTVQTDCPNWSLGMRFPSNRHWYTLTTRYTYTHATNEGVFYFNARAGQNSLLRFAGLDHYSGDYTITATQFGPPLPNDFCDAPSQILLDQPVTGTTVNATTDHPPCQGEDYFDTWHTFTAPTAGTYRITYPAQFVLGLFNTCDQMEPLHRFDSYDSPGRFRAAAGESFLIRVARNWYVGPYELTINRLGDAPEHDDLPAAVPLALNVPFSGSTINATGRDVTSCACQDSYDVWHSVTIPQTGIYTVELADADFDARTAVFTAAWPAWLDELEELTCHRPCDPRSNAFFARAGQTCFIRVAGADRTTGNYTIALNASLTADTNADGHVDLLDLLALQQAWLHSDCSITDWCSQADTDRSGTVDLNDFAWLQALWSITAP